MNLGNCLGNCVSCGNNCRGYQTGQSYENSSKGYSLDNQYNQGGNNYETFSY